nr:immunoglobulin heavy chain junction region [Mus musculus]NSM04013.1 immunoglobulin heavy chain junction region [Mus musculus]NSM04529.1 immunoglobulin heavy chain junction region [Mus musculus]NSM05061.1 immunoglobulin heavy chain junction region [Mus musculus]NSM05866.1 immunoglobulin heavy chain junction region [Mus musculus]
CAKGGYYYGSSPYAMDYW